MPLLLRLRRFLPRLAMMILWNEFRELERYWIPSSIERIKKAAGAFQRLYKRRWQLNGLLTLAFRLGRFLALWRLGLGLSPHLNRFAAVRIQADFNTILAALKIDNASLALNDLADL